MNRLKKTVAVLSILVLSGSFIFAKEKSDNPYDETEPVLNPKTKKPYDFENMNIIIADYLPKNTKETTNVKSSRQYWEEWMFKTYNMSIIQKTVWNAEEYPKMMANYCVSDGNENYVFVIDDRNAALGVRANLFYDLSKIESVNFHDYKKYNQNAVNKLKRGRSFYAYGWEKNEPLLGVYFNKRMLQEKGFSSEYLYDLQFDGRWTWDAFERLCNMITADTDYDGESDVYAMSSDVYDFVPLCLDSNDTSLVSRDYDGNYSSNIINMKTMEAFTWMNRIWKKHQMPDKLNEGPDYCYKAFIDGKTAFLVGHQDPRVANHDFTAMKDEYGFVCFPLGPKSNGIYKTISDTRMVVIPSCYEKSRVEKIVMAIDFWLEPVPSSSTTDTWKANYLSQFRDSRVMDETLVMMNDTPNPRLDVLIRKIDFNATYRNIVNGVNTPEEEYFFNRIGWSNVFDNYNQYVEKRSRLTNDEIEQIREEEARNIHRTKITKREAVEGEDAAGMENAAPTTDAKIIAEEEASSSKGKKAKKKKTKK